MKYIQSAPWPVGGKRTVGVYHVAVSMQLNAKFDLLTSKYSELLLLENPQLLNIQVLIGPNRANWMVSTHMANPTTN